MLNSKGNKELIIIGGPNGSGKTTLARELLKENADEYVSADDIAYELNPKNPLAARLVAGKEFFKRLDRFANDGTNLLIESTLSGKSLLNVIAKFQKIFGYTVSIVFIFLDSEATCIERIQTRVQKGGHPVPEKDVVRRFGRSIVNFWNEYRLLSADGCYTTTPRTAFKKSPIIRKMRFMCMMSLYSLHLKKWQNIMDKNNHNMFEFTARLTKIGNRAVRKAQEENRKLGIPNVYAKRGCIYYQMPDGTITVEKPKELVNN